jgi:hypothetical protein
MLAGLALSLASQLLQGIAGAGGYCLALVGELFFHAGPQLAFVLAGLALSRAGSLPQGSGMDLPLCSAELPAVLRLLSTCNACYTSLIDKPSGR